jgi:HTH-type transcriptional regulator/antitoxin HigA
MMTKPEDSRHIPRFLAECGVRFVLVENLPQSKIDGVCFWLDDRTPVIGMSTRYDRIDNFWFVIRHEIEHVLQRHGMQCAIVDAELEGQNAGTGTTVSNIERIANAAAANFCVPSEKLDSFIKRKHPLYYERDVVAFAKVNGIHPGLVVGQMQHRLNRYDYLRKYQAKIRHFILPGAYADGWGQLLPL